MTKRVERIADNLPKDWGNGYENVDLNITCENQRTFNLRWPLFTQIPAGHKGINIAPCLGPIDITLALASGQLENVNLGGEGFGGQRPCHYAWVHKVSCDCQAYGVNFTFNATGSNFVKDGKNYSIASQRQQAEQAYLSGLSRFFRAPTYKLYDPMDGHALQSSELMLRRYHLQRCTFCSNLEACIGCVACGSCKKPELVELDEIIRLRQKRHLPGADRSCA